MDKDNKSSRLKRSLSLETLLWPHKDLCTSGKKLVCSGSISDWTEQNPSDRTNEEDILTLVIKRNQ